MTHRYDVFISYSHDDANWVRQELLRKLEERGFDVCIDFRSFQTGSFSVEEMQRATEDSKRVLAVLSPKYIESEWRKFENVMAQTMDPAAIQRKIIPVLLKECSTPLRLRILHHRDLRKTMIRPNGNCFLET
jgi:hypothetical protein